MLPAAIANRYRLAVQGRELRITVDNSLADAFLAPYQSLLRSSWLKRQILIEQELDFPLESFRQQSDLQEAANHFFGLTKSFWTEVGFPNSSRGRYQQQLWMARRIKRYLGYSVFYVPCHHEVMEEGQVNNLTWKRILSVWPQEFSLSFVTYSFVSLPMALIESAYQNTLVETRIEQQIWLTITDLLHSRFYLGCDCFYSHLAHLLDIPCIILPNQGDSDPCIRYRHPEVIYVDQYNSYEAVLDAYRTMERLLLPEH